MSAGETKSILVEVFYLEGCNCAPPTIRQIEAAAAELGIAIELKRTIVDKTRGAVELRFLGSPTVHINGLDLDPAARQCTVYGFG